MKMMNSKKIAPASKSLSRMRTRVMVALTTMASPALVWAGSPGTFGDTGKKVCGFFTNINSILDMVSIAVVTLAVIIAGYQIAFAHKRIADVAPILIGGVLIGVASQVAGMLIGTDTATGQKCAALLLQTINTVYA